MRASLDWTDAVIETINDVTPTVREFTLSTFDGAFPHTPGSHLQVQILVNGRPQTRSYSLIGLGENSTYRIAVKRLDEGRGGSLAMWRLAPGDRIKVSEPQNHFALDLLAPTSLLVAGGIGITPLVGMAQTLAQRGTPVRMLYGARNAQEFAYAEVLKKSLGDSLALVDSQAGGSIDFVAEIAALPANAQMYVCGPVPMLDDARRAWEDSGRPPANLRYETFGSSGRLAPKPFRVHLPRHRLDITVAQDCTLLEALESAGVQAVSDCRKGECGLCAMDVLKLDGEIDHRDVFLSDDDKEENRRICACVSRVVGTVTLDSAFRPDAI